MKTLLWIVMLAVALPCHAAVDYETQIKPIFESRCTKCHGEKRRLGDLAMHTNALPELIEDGLILAGDADSSEVYNRLILPEDDKLRMPKGGDPLPEQQIQLIKTWINNGALLTKVAGVAPMPVDAMPDEKSPAPAAPAPASEATLAALQQVGATVVPLYAVSPLLSISFPSSREQITDATLDLVAAAGPNVVWLNLAGTKVTDAGVAKLAACTNLSRLHLENTQITDAAADVLAGLQQLEYLNLYGDQITDAALKQIATLPKLTALYVWQTDVTYEAAKKLMADRQQLNINLGWNHPGVLRERIATELQRVVASKEELAKKAAQAEATLKEAKQQLEAAKASEQQLKKELEALAKPTKEQPLSREE